MVFASRGRFAVSAFVTVVAASWIATACNKHEFVGMPGNLVAEPTTLDFGRVHEQDELGQVVKLKNVGTNTIKVTGLEIVPANAPYTLNITMPTAAAPWIIGSGEFHAVDVHFAPLSSGDSSAQIIVHSDDPDSPALPVPIAGKGYHTQTDSYSQGASIGGKADILFVVDNSGSMEDKQTKLGNSFTTFIDWLTTKAVDYHIAVTTTDMDDPTAQGHFRGSPKVIDNTTPNVVNTFKQNVNVGTTGSGTEKGFAGGGAAISAPLVTGDNAGFLRTDAKLFMVYVSDEDDQSGGSVQSFIDSARAAKGGDASKVFFAAIAGPPPTGCFNFSASADSGQRYHDITSQTTGLFGSICDNDFGVTLQNLAFQVTASAGTFVLTQQPDISTLVVFVAGVQAPPTEWAYDPASNSVSFIAPWIPAGGVPVVIVYDVL